MCWNGRGKVQEMAWEYESAGMGYVLPQQNHEELKILLVAPFSRVFFVISQISLVYQNVPKPNECSLNERSTQAAVFFLSSTVDKNFTCGDQLESREFFAVRFSQSDANIHDNWASQPLCVSGVKKP